MRWNFFAALAVEGRYQQGNAPSNYAGDVKQRSLDFAGIASCIGKNRLPV